MTNVSKLIHNDILRVERSIKAEYKRIGSLEDRIEASRNNIRRFELDIEKLEKALKDLNKETYNFDRVTMLREVKSWNEVADIFGVDVDWLRKKYYRDRKKRKRS